MDVVLLLVRLLLAGVFVVAGLTKLVDLAGSRQAMRGFGLPEPLAKPAGLALPIAELVVAVLLIPTATAAWGGLGALVLLLVFVAGIGYNLARGRKPDCHCFGQLHSEPIGQGTLIRNAVLAALAALVVGWGFAEDEPGASAVAWIGDLSGLEVVALLGGLIALGLLVAIGWLLTHLLGQNGRLLVRLDAIEAALADAGIELPESGAAAEAEPEPEVGLPIGSPAPAFSLSGLHGETMTLNALRAAGKPVLLVFSDPNCGPCNALLPDLGKWQREHAAQLTVAMISRGTAEANKGKSAEHGLSHVLLQQDWEVSNAYQAHGTPNAILVRADGTIGSAPAPGAENIRNLVARAVGGQLPVAAGGNGPRPAAQPQAQAQPQPVRGAANIGKPAPEVALPDLGGQTVNLADFRGQPTAVLFWNPGCGFCQRMIPDLKKWEENPPEGAPKLLVVSTGDVERNKEMGLKSPVVLDEGFNTGRAFGASGTPSAVLVDAEGNVGSGVAVGAPGVLGLLGGEVPEPVAPNGADRAPTPRVGDPAPAVRLPDLSGKTVDLATHRGTKTLVLFWNPGCGFCARMLDDLKAWENNRPKGAPKLLIVSTGDVEENRAMGLKSPVVLDPNFSVGRSFGASGTPSAVLVDARGRIASEVAVGAPSVLALANGEDPAKIAPPAADDGADDMPEALPIGAEAPDLELPDLDGNPVKLAEVFRGNRTAVLFWNPGCGFCQRMVNDLKKWENKPPAGAPQLLFISSGSAEENRAQGLKSRFLLDDAFRAGTAFGTDGTPSAILVDADGKIASEMGVGAPDVMKLLNTKDKAKPTMV